MIDQSEKKHLFFVLKVYIIVAKNMQSDKT
jgi:hypothetical protein